MSERNWQDPQYVRWRKLVRHRAGGHCQMCGSRRGCQAHHIVRWADCPELRYSPANGCLLCKRCHQRVTGNEADYQRLLSSLSDGPLQDHYFRYLMDKYA